ncbi:MAG: SufS family cysteine desulfurase [Bifidobacteriaceae bacterium]|nr:SufS family cysteine desulfurase [Bifidobacteriaceae bacterium]
MTAPQNAASADAVFNGIRRQFPILDRTVHGKPLTYFDSAATAQKPRVVIDAESRYYETINAGVHRGAHELAAQATLAFEEARRRAGRLVGAEEHEGQEEIVVTSGATAAFNLLATAIGNASVGAGRPESKRFALRPGDKVVVSQVEHHSVLLPFQELCARTGAKLSWLETDDEGSIRSQDADTIITPGTKIVAVTLVSNVTGAVTNLTPIVERSHAVGAIVVLDLCQATPHLPVDVHALDVDFACWSAHKMYGPTGVGFLYGRRELLEALPPANFGGSMVGLAWLDRPARYMDPPERFEAGTQPVAQAIAAGVASEWLRNIGLDAVAEHERAVTQELLRVGDVPGVRILGKSSLDGRIGTVSFDVEGVHPHDVGQFLDAQGIAIRTGYHCAQPIHRRFGLFASNRASVGVYNTVEEARRLVDAVAQVRPYFLGVKA